jgi:hypothetical protein
MDHALTRLPVANGIATVLLISACASAPAMTARRDSPRSDAVSSSSAGTSPIGPAAAVRPGDWPTYHRTNDRAGLAPGAPAPHGLRQA